MNATGASVRVSRDRLDDLLVLTKVRLNALVVATTAGGYYMAAPPAIT